MRSLVGLSDNTGFTLNGSDQFNFNFFYRTKSIDYCF